MSTVLKVGTITPQKTAKGLHQTGAGELLVYNVQDGASSIVGNIPEPFNDGYKGPIANFGLRVYSEFHVEGRVNRITISKERVYVLTKETALIYTLGGKLIWERNISDIAYGETVFDSDTSSELYFTFFKEIQGVVYLGTKNYCYKISIDTGEVVPFSDTIDRITFTAPHRNAGASNSISDHIINVFDDKLIIRTGKIEAYDLDGTFLYVTDAGGEIVASDPIESMVYGDGVLMVQVSRTGIYALDILNGNKIGMTLSVPYLSYILQYRDDKFVSVQNVRRIHSITKAQIQNNENFTEDTEYSSEISESRGLGMNADGKIAIISERRELVVANDTDYFIEFKLDLKALDGSDYNNHDHSRLSVNRFGQLALSRQGRCFVLSTGLFIKNYGIVS